MRRVIGGLAHGILCVGGFLVFAIVMALLFFLLNAIGGGIVNGLRMDPKGVVGSLIGVLIPGMVSVSLGLKIVFKGLDPLFDRLEHWKAQ